MTLREALRSKLFWLMYAVAMLVCVGFFVPMVHLGALRAGRRAMSEAQGVSLVSLIGLGSLLGRFAMGGVADRLGHACARWRLIVPGHGAHVARCGGLATGFWLLAVFAVGFGTSTAAYVALARRSCMDLFGRELGLGDSRLPSTRRPDSAP